MQDINSRVGLFHPAVFFELLIAVCQGKWIMKKSVSFVLLTMSFVVMLFSIPAQAVERAELLSSMCVTCHGPDGRGSKKIPKLKGLKVSDIVESMKGFKTGEESSTIMERHAKGYTDEEVKLMAEYFAAK